MADPADIGPMRPCMKCFTWGPSETCERCEAEARNRASVAEGPHEQGGPSFDLMVEDEMAGLDGAPGEPGRVDIFSDEMTFAQTHRVAAPEPTITLESVMQTMHDLQKLAPPLETRFFNGTVEWAASAPFLIALDRLAWTPRLSPSELRAHIEKEIQEELDRRRGKR